MKHLLVCGMILISLVFAGCGNTSFVASPENSTTIERENNNGDNDRQNIDFGPYHGQEYLINQTKELYDFRVTLDKIIIGNQNFGKYDDGYALLISTGYSSRRIIGEFTITAKVPANLSTLYFSIGWHTNGGGSTYSYLAQQGRLSTGAIKFGFYEQGADMPMTGNEIKKIKVISPLLDRDSGNDYYYFQVSDNKYLMDTEGKRKEVEFDISDYLPPEWKKSK